MGTRDPLIQPVLLTFGVHVNYLYTSTRVVALGPENMLIAAVSSAARLISGSTPQKLKTGVNGGWAIKKRLSAAVDGCLLGNENGWYKLDHHAVTIYCSHQ